MPKESRPSVDWLLYKFHPETRMHSRAEVRRGRQIVARVYQCDTLPDSALETIRKHYPGAYRGVVGPRYAPEIRHSSVIVPTDAETRRKSRALA